MRKDEVLRQLDAAIAEGMTVPEGRMATRQRGTEVTFLLLSTLDQIAAPGSTYAKAADQIREAAARSVEGYYVPNLTGILNSLRLEVQHGYLKSLSSLMRADTFGDFLERADYLIVADHKDAAAVIAGTVLEQHLRSMAQISNVEVQTDGKWRKAESINADLVKAGAHLEAEKKQVTAWLAIRNDAAHGDYNAYSSEKVSLMIAGLRLYIAQHPA